MSEKEEHSQSLSEEESSITDKLEDQVSQRTKMAVPVSNNITTFCVGDDDLEEYLKVLEHSFLVYETTDAKKVSSLITTGGKDLAKQIFKLTK